MDERLPRQRMRRRCWHRDGARRTDGYLRWALRVPLLVAALVGGSLSVAQATRTDAGHPVAAVRHQLQLDHGQRWPPDTALREGMRRIRAVALWMQHAQADGPLSARQSRAATASIEDAVAAIVDRPPRGGMDANLRLLLGRVLAADELPQLLDALELYPRYFADPDWRPLTANASPDHEPPGDSGASTHATQP